MYFLYRVEDQSILRISLSDAVDRYFWQQRDQTVQTVFQTSSFSKAVAMAGQFSSECLRPFTSEIVKPKILEEDWCEWRREAEEIFSFLQGRALLWQEVKEALKSNKRVLTDAKLRTLLQILHLQKKVEYLPGVEHSPWAVQRKCHRCQADASQILLTSCSRCGEECAYCKHCLLLGRSQSCLPFFLFARCEDLEEGTLSPFPLCLTPPQQSVQPEIMAWLNSTKKRLLLWAVTGAGKTEILLPAVREVLQCGGRVLWCTPRKDVVHELAPRMERIFPDEKITSLYGQSPDLWQSGSIVLATSHQVMRFVNAFDLTIVDEVDAFPLHGNQALEKGIDRACAKSGKQILLTATPPSDWQEGQGQTLITLPVRYHGHPLPVPSLYRSGGLWRDVDRKRPIPLISRFLMRVREERGQALLFVPRIGDVQRLLAWLRERESAFYDQVEGVHGRDDCRQAKIEDFRQGNLTGLLTTTILERGVTVSRCHVLVVGAEHLLFDRQSLIQIAGRVGRSPEYQEGEVWFLAAEKTEAQRRARDEIRWLNRIGRKLDYGT